MSTPVRSLGLSKSPLLSKYAGPDSTTQPSETSTTLLPTSSSETDEVRRPKDNYGGGDCRSGSDATIKAGKSSPNFSHVILQAGEMAAGSESDSFRNPTRKRSRSSQTNPRRYSLVGLKHEVDFNTATKKRVRRGILTRQNPGISPEKTSPPASDITTEEDLALCLVMLSRDNRGRGIEGSVDKTTCFKVVKERYSCESCNKAFKSYQALGGHMASHRKVIKIEALGGGQAKNEDSGEVQSGSAHGSPASTDCKKKLHECPHCFKVFSSGQALGGHKRSHTFSSVESMMLSDVKRILNPTHMTTISTSACFKDHIDLNLPATVDDDDAFGTKLKFHPCMLI